MSVDRLKIFSFFSGSGLLDLGFENNEYEIVFVNEYFEPFMNAYQHARQNLHMEVPRFGYQCSDINVFLNERNIELHDYINSIHAENNLAGFIGGPPCPDFSIAGRQAGRDGNNGRLSQSYVELIINCLPDFFLFENVKGLWSTRKHREYYDELKQMLHDSGYVTTEKLVNSLEYGVPQERERVILIGLRRELVNSNFVVNNEITNFLWDTNIRYHLNDINQIIWPTTNPFIEDSLMPCPANIIRELTIEHWFQQNDINNHPNSNDYFTPRAGITRMQTIEEGDADKKSYKRLHRWRYSPTAAYGNNEVHLHPYKVRRISASEAMAIQSLPRDFILPEYMSLTNKFKTIGNGVPYLVANGIARAILLYMEGIL